jgi:hypothetical protein
LFTAIFEIYNLVSMIQSDGPELGNIQERIGLNPSKNFNVTFMSKRTHCDTGESGISDSLWHGEHVYHDRQVVDAFTRAGYMLESNDEDENGWAPLNKVKQPSTPSVDCWLELMRYMQLKPAMRHAIQSSGTAVVVKLLRPGSNKLPINISTRSRIITHSLTRDAQI